MSQCRYYMLTIPHHLFVPYLPSGIKYIKGQTELAASGYLHWQIVVICERSRRASWVTSVFGTSCHVERTRSEAAMAYVWKEDTCVVGTRFELGVLPRNTRFNCADWDDVLNQAKEGDYDQIESGILVRCFNSIQKVHAHYARPVAIEKTVKVFWGETGSGKSRRAWEEATFDAYPKIPTTKFWDGYRGHQHVVIDEFSGLVNITLLLQWLDRYPTLVEIKGSAVPFKSTNIWITSNIDPRNWYPDATDEQKLALLRRFTEVIHFSNLSSLTF